MKITKSIALGVASLALALSGCGGQDDIDRPALAMEEKVSDNNSHLYDLDGLDQDSIDRAFIAYMTSEDPVAFGLVPEEDLILLAKAMCGFIDRGADFEDVATAAMDSGYTAEQGGALIGAGVVAYCPENEGIM